MAGITSLKLMELDFGRGWAGGQSQSFALVQGLAERGHQLTCVGRADGVWLERLADLPVQSTALSLGGRLDLAAVARLAALMRQQQPQIIHSHDSLSFWLAGLAARMAQVNAALITHKRTDHSPGRAVLWRYRKLVDRVIAISGAAERALLQAGVPQEKIALVYSSVDTDRFHPGEVTKAAHFRAEVGLPPEALLVGTIGSLVPRKGHAVLLEAAQAILRDFPLARFVICGSGELENSLKEQADKLAIADQVRFIGEWEDVRPLLASLEVFVLPSLAEGLGVSALEAMALGKALVVSRVGGLAETVAEGCSGLLVEPGNPAQLGEAIKRLLGDAALRETLGANARLRAECTFSRKVMTDRTEEVYFSCIS